MNELNEKAAVIIRKALEIWGPNGEKYLKGSLSGAHGSICSNGALLRASGYEGVLEESFPLLEHHYTPEVCVALESVIKAAGRNVNKDWKMNVQTLCSINNYNDFATVKGYFETAATQLEAS